MFSEAMRVCREYLPSQEAALRRELGQRAGQSDFSDVDAILEEARRWLEMGETRAALDLLLRESHVPRSALLLAADILLHRAGPELATQLGADLGTRLFAINEHALAAQV
jgi:intraflagellar transport protein 172